MSSVTESMKKLSNSGQLIRVNLDDVYINVDDNIRATYNEEEMAGLSASIQATGGILQPITLAAVDPCEENGNKSYMLIAGFRRSITLLNLAEQDEQYKMNVPAMVVTQDSNTGIKLTQLIENMQRSDLTPMEQCNAIKLAMSDGEVQLNQRDVAGILGVSEAKLSKLLSLDGLPDPIKAMLSNGEISFSHAALIARSVPAESQLKAAAMAKSLAYPDFEKKVQTQYRSLQEDSESPEDESAEATTTATQKPAQARRASVVQKTYMPYIQGQIDAATDPATKSRWQTRYDAIRWVMNAGDTSIGSDLKPFEDDLEKKKAEAEASKTAESERNKFIKTEVTLFRKLRKMVPADGQRKSTVAEDWATVKHDVEKHAKAKGDEALKFTLGNVDDFIKELSEEFSEQEKAREETKKKHAEKKAAEAAAEKAAAETAGTSGKAAAATAGAK